MATSESKWHQAAREAIAELLARRSAPGPGPGRKRWLMKHQDRPGQFRSGYGRAVWAFEATAATTGHQAAKGGTPLKGEFPMDERQRRFFGETGEAENRIGG